MSNGTMTGVNFKVIRPQFPGETEEKHEISPESQFLKQG